MVDKIKENLHIVLPAVGIIMLMIVLFGGCGREDNTPPPAPPQNSSPTTSPPPAPELSPDAKKGGESPPMPPPQPQVAQPTETEKEIPKVPLPGPDSIELKDKDGKVVSYINPGEKVEYVGKEGKMIKVKREDAVEGYISLCKKEKEKEVKKENQEVVKKQKEKEKVVKRDEKEKEVKQKEKVANKEEESIATNKVRLAVVCKSNKECVFYDNGASYKVGDIWRGYTINAINIFSIEVIDKNGRVRTLEIE